MRLIIVLVIVSLCAVSCVEKRKEENSVIVRVNDKTLTFDELKENIPTNINPEDSLITAEHFIQSWIIDNLLYEKAADNIPDKGRIDQLVENYRRSLVVYQYKEQMINEKLSPDISREEQLQFFEENKDRFQLDRTLIKGLFIRVPRDAQDIDKVRAWSKQATPAALEQIEKYCVKNAAPYNYITDDWVDVNELMASWPINLGAGNELATNDFIEKSDDKFYYFLHIIDRLLPGDNAPFDYAQTTIKEILINQKKIQFIKTLEEELYRKALNSGKIEFYEEINK